MSQSPRLVHAPELPANLSWFNTPKPLTLGGLRGKVVLLDFWTYCCINCMHILGDLRYLEEKFAQAPFQVIGVHCPKFPNEKVDHHVQHAIQRYGILHPVVVDSDFRIWQSFAVRAWPTLVVIDPVGYVVGHLPGEGHRGQIEQYLEQALPHYRQEGVLREGGAAVMGEQPGVAARAAAGVLAYPGKVAAHPESGTLWIADTGHHQLVQARPTGQVLRRIGSGQPGLADGEGALASLREPQGLLVHRGQVLVADTGNHAIRAVSLDSGRVTTLAGTGEQAEYGARGGNARTSRLNSPWDLTLADGVLYVAMAGPHQLWRLDLERCLMEPHAGSGREEITDGPLAAAALAQPSGIAQLGDELVFMDSEVSALRAASIKAGGAVRTLIGGGLFVFGDQDGPLGQALLQHPLGLAVHDGKVYVADTYNHKIKVYDPADGWLRTLAGTGASGAQDGPLAQAQFHEPGGLAWLGEHLFVADTNNHRLRRVDLASGQVETVPLREG